ncbi:MAG: YddF family protein [Candidatus Pacebacteria bacterium]|nr:YddF family protein [Candidatus Paceibacterota bacterium]
MAGIAQNENAVIISAPLIIQEGEYSVRRIGIEEARAWVRQHQPVNYCGHATVRVLGYEPAATRRHCPGYTEALAIKPAKRLEFGREYTRKEIEAIGFDLLLISRKKDREQRTSLDVPRYDDTAKST